MEYTVEICANSAQSCIAAERGGAQRVELCAGMPEGGTTPSMGEIEAARRAIGIRLHVIIRPRGGDFLYSPLEQQIMERDIHAAKAAGADGVVFGCLTEEGEVDTAVMERLMRAAEGLSVTFHRAFDRCRDPFAALERIVSLGCDRILTSGQRPTAEEGIPLLAQLVGRAAGRIGIMPGAGINERNIARIAAATGACEFHFSARTEIRSRMRLRNPEVSMGNNEADEYVRSITSEERVRRTIEALKGRR